MFGGKTNLNEQEQLHKRTLAIVYGGNSLNYDDILLFGQFPLIWLNTREINLVNINDLFICKEFK